MTPPVRPEIVAASELPDIEGSSLRDLVEWFKKVVNVPIPDMPTEMEVQYINSQWVELCRQLAEREGVPAGWVSQLVGGLARGELAVAASAEVEAEQAVLV